ncbi:type I-C CRISPR-associated protein Cas5c [Marinobacter persicus]|uniref:pre-crRNA processing endonuclease n=1 Tax=Marinobacter persicus TaxID=930118 RepID=A0A2S6G832_9GAMM|nr:type I-C CRISPR-associated protein Cas5c [Marinobacter persicus]PPK52380.1 CRISPR-associated Cas5d family protein [Marinobacter persicus]PPK55356.1 CRISPR-associated Cas5d family protein [Marinobacter persicus]PPK59123.1 CRISPR-associated Cas5d family protein [Marinobacter persicus]
MGFCLEVSGEFACFTRPEMKVERVSYDVITPSAARAIFEAILWKPAIEWHITEIEVLNPIRWMNLRRNEVESIASSRTAKTAMKEGSGLLGVYADEQRQQRASLLLKDVRYRIHGEFSITGKAGPQDNAAKFADMFRRRAEKGQCFNQPYLGCREFSCDFALADEDGGAPAIDENRDLGFMLYDLDYSDPTAPTPLFFRARMDKGRIVVPAKDSHEVRG